MPSTWPFSIFTNGWVKRSNNFKVHLKIALSAKGEQMITTCQVQFGAHCVLISLIFSDFVYIIHCFMLFLQSFDRVHQTYNRKLKLNEIVTSISEPYFSLQSCKTHWPEAFPPVWHFCAQTRYATIFRPKIMGTQYLQYKQTYLGKCVSSRLIGSW